MHNYSSAYLYITCIIIQWFRDRRLYNTRSQIARYITGAIGVARNRRAMAVRAPLKKGTALAVPGVAPFIGVEAGFVIPAVGLFPVLGVVRGLHGVVLAGSREPRVFPVATRAVLIFILPVVATFGTLHFVFLLLLFPLDGFIITEKGLFVNPFLKLFYLLFT